MKGDVISDHFLMLPNFQRYVFLTLKTTFSLKKTKKSQKPLLRKISSILDIEGSILDTVRECENASRLGLQDSLRLRFSALIPTLAFINGACEYGLFLLDLKKKSI